MPPVDSDRVSGGEGSNVAAPTEIVSAAGKLWYTDPAANGIGMIDPANPGNPQLITQGVPTSPTGARAG